MSISGSIRYMLKARKQDSEPLATSEASRGASRRTGGRVARPAGLEPAAPSLEGSCSIQLSYGRLTR